MTKSFPADLSGLAACQEFVASQCESPRPQIIMDEIVSNIVRCSGAKTFEVESTLVPGELTLVFRDDGVAFDPTAVAAPDVTQDAGEREVGGLGIFMVRKMAKSVSYARQGSHNVLTVVMSV